MSTFLALAVIASVNLFTPLWIGWGIMFLFIEFTAVWSKSHHKSEGNGTLSALVWRSTAWKHHKFFRLLICIGWVILTTHFFFLWP